MLHSWLVGWLVAWTFQTYLPAGRVRSLYAQGDEVLLVTPGGFLLMDAPTGAPLQGIPVPATPVLAVLNPSGSTIFWVDESGVLYRTDRHSLHTARLAHVGQGHSLAYGEDRIFFITLNDQVVTLDPSGFIQRDPPPAGLIWAGLRGSVPEGHPGRVFLDPLRTRLDHYDPLRNVAWVVEDSGLVRLDLQTAQRRFYGFPTPPVYPLSGMLARSVWRVFGEGGIAQREQERWRWIPAGVRVVDGCEGGETFLSPFALVRVRDGMTQRFPLPGGPFQRIVCSREGVWVGGEGGVYEVGRGLHLSLRVHDLVWTDRLVVASELGVFVLQDTTWHQLQDTAGLLSDEVLDLDAGFGEVWAATRRGVVRIYPDHKVMRPGMERIVVEGAGRLVGWNGQIFVLEGEGAYPIFPPQEIREVVDLERGDTGEVMVVVPQGIWVLRP